MRFVVALLVLVACAPSSGPTQTLAPSAPPDASAAAAATPPAHGAITTFAAARGGLSAGPFVTPVGELFFVGRAAADAAWVVTPASNPDVPHDDVRTRAEGDLVYRRIDDWPHGVVVRAVEVERAAIGIGLESLSMRGQPGGAFGVVTLFASRDSTQLEIERAHPGQWRHLGAPSMADAMKSWHAEVAAHAMGGDDALAEQAAALVRMPALESTLAKSGARAVRVWQGIFAGGSEPLVRGSAALRVAVAGVRALDPTSLFAQRDGIVTSFRDREGLVFGTSAARALEAVVLSGTAPPGNEHAPTPTPGEDLDALRASAEVGAHPRTLVRVSLGDAHTLSVLADDARGYVVERQGAYTDVADTLFSGPVLDARVADVNRDGVADVVFMLKRTPSDARHAVDRNVVVLLRKNAVDGGIHGASFELEVEVAGAATLDEVLARTSAPASPKMTVRPAEACATMRSAATAAGFRRHATAQARVLAFDTPEMPSLVERSVPLDALTDDDVSWLKDECAGNETPFRCEGSLCGHLEYGLTSLVRFTRERGVLKIDAALAYSGS